MYNLRLVTLSIINLVDYVCKFNEDRKLTLPVTDECREYFSFPYGEVNVDLIIKLESLS